MGEDAKAEKLSWEEVLKLSDTLANKIKISGFEPQLLVALARGGWIPARLLSDRLGVKRLVSIGLAYEDAARTKLVPYSLPGEPTKGQKILLIEDRLESGRSLKRAAEILLEQGAIVKTACYFFRQDSVVEPDYYETQTDSDIIFPWE